MIENFARLIPGALLGRSGRVFYSGRNAFSTESDLYVVGVNPGGRPQDHLDDTLSSHTEWVLNSAPDNWSAYSDEAWAGTKPGTTRSPGTAPMQRRMQHLFRKLGVNPGDVPASNIVFIRSERMDTLEGDFSDLKTKCWSFHEAVVESLKIRVIVCLGGAAGEEVCTRVGALTPVGEFVERNNRRWASRAYMNRSGLTVAVLTHPSIVDWTNQSTDPSDLLLRVLGG